MDQSSHHFNTLIIGAGISGLACARRLFHHEPWRRAGRLCVLEGRDRIGGRIESVNVRGCRLDTGANWIHGVGTTENPNPLMSILPEKRARPLAGSVVFRPSCSPDARHSHDDQDDWVTVSAPVPPSSSPMMVTRDLVTPSEDADKLTTALWSTIGALHSLAHNTPATDAGDTTVLTAISKSSTFRGGFSSVDPKYHAALRALPQFLENIEAAPLNATSAEHEQDKPGMSLLEFRIDDFEGEQVFLQDGYAAVVQEVAKDLLERGIIRTGVEVERVNWDTTPIEIFTSEGTYTANEVVCTLPLGVLKQRQQNLFLPVLPKDYQSAIEALGFGTLDKIFMLYSLAWWTEEPYKSIIKKGISRSPVNQEAKNFQHVTDDRNKDEPDFFIGFTDQLSGVEIHEDGSATEGLRLLSLTNLHSLTGFPVLSSFISCANARHVENLSDAEAGEMIHRNLTTWFGREPPQPTAVYVTRWAADPFSKGSYSHMVTGVSERKHREQFQQPLKGTNDSVLRFAGEHTSSDHFATVHGALISGWDAADAIIGGRS